VSRGATEDLVAMLPDYEQSELPERTKAALRLADALSSDHRSVDRTFYEELRRHFSEEQILDLGMTIAFVSGWQRFIDAFGIVPDRWSEGGPPPFQPITGDPRAPGYSRQQDLGIQNVDP
jgi:alkylhydroperoxidase family enzyme